MDLSTEMVGMRKMCVKFIFKKTPQTPKIQKVCDVSLEKHGKVSFMLLTQKDRWCMLAWTYCEHKQTGQRFCLFTTSWKPSQHKTFPWCPYHGGAMVEHKQNIPVIPWEALMFAGTTLNKLNPSKLYKKKSHRSVGALDPLTTKVTWCETITWINEEN